MKENNKFGMINAKMIGIYSGSCLTIDGSRIYAASPIITFENYEQGELKGIKVKDKTFFKFGSETSAFEIKESEIPFTKDKILLDNLSEGSIITFQAEIEIITEIVSHTAFSERVFRVNPLRISDIKKYQDKNAAKKIKNLIMDNIVSYKFFHKKPKDLEELKEILNKLKLNQMSINTIIFYILCLIKHDDSFIVEKDFKKYAKYWSQKQIETAFLDLKELGYFSEPCFDGAYVSGF